MTGLWGEPLFAMEDHDEAYIRWKQEGIRGGHVLHLDTHLDFSDEHMEEKTMEKIRSAESVRELEALRDPPWKVGSGIDPGNYLYPAAMDGTLRTLCWIVPEHMKEGDFLTSLRIELTRWVDLKLGEYDSLTVSGGVARGAIKGVPLCVAGLEHEEDGGSQLLLDIDLDFIFDCSDAVWIRPHDLVRRLRKQVKAPLMTTVAYSVNGGYTPREHRYLGDILIDLLQGDDRVPEAVVDGIVEGDTHLRESRFDEAEACWLPHMENSVVRPALCVKMARIEREYRNDKDEASRWEMKALEADARYEGNPLDDAMVAYRAKKYELALSILKESERDERLFIPAHLVMGHIYCERDNWHDAQASWNAILSRTGGSTEGLSYLYRLIGVARWKCGEPEGALQALKASASAAPENSFTWLHMGLALRDMGKREEAAYQIRKALRLNPDSIAMVDAHRILGGIYLSLGKKALAQAELLQLKRKDRGGRLAIEFLLRRF